MTKGKGCTKTKKYWTLKIISFLKVSILKCTKNSSNCTCTISLNYHVQLFGYKRTSRLVIKKQHEDQLKQWLLNLIGFSLTDDTIWGRLQGFRAYGQSKDVDLYLAREGDWSWLVVTFCLRIDNKQNEWRMARKKKLKPDCLEIKNVTRMSRKK